jgi:hypothetical protein
MFFQNVTISFPTSTIISIGVPVLLPPSVYGGSLGWGFSTQLNKHECCKCDNNWLVATATTASFLPQTHVANENRVAYSVLRTWQSALCLLPPPPIEWLEKGLSEPKASSEIDESDEFCDQRSKEYRTTLFRAIF